MSGDASPRPLVASAIDDEVQFIGGAPEGWRKKLTPKGKGTPRWKAVVFVAPDGVEIRSRTHLERYLKANTGGPLPSHFDWSSGETPRRSERLSSQSRRLVESPAVHLPARKPKRAAEENDETPVKRVKRGRSTKSAREEDHNLEVTSSEIATPSVKESMEDKESKELELQVSIFEPEPKPEPAVLSVHEAETQADSAPEPEPESASVAEAKLQPVSVPKPEDERMVASLIEDSDRPADSKVTMEEASKDEKYVAVQAKDESLPVFLKHDEDTEMNVMPEGTVKSQGGADISADFAASTEVDTVEVDGSFDKRPLGCEVKGVDVVGDELSSEIRTVEVIQEANGCHPQRQKDEVQASMQSGDEEINEKSDFSKNNDSLNGDFVIADSHGPNDHLETVISKSDHSKSEIASFFGVAKPQEAHPAEVGVNS